MSKTPDNIVGFKANTPDRFRIAYTLNDTQPVRCTIIDDQPLFFMDFDGADDLCFDDDDLLFATEGLFADDLAEAAFLESQENFSALSKEVDEDAYKTSLLPENILLTEDLSFISSPYQPTGDQEATALLESLKQSRWAAAYLDFAKKYDLRVILHAQAETAYYDRYSSSIFINPELEEADQILLLARELRRFWQHRSGAMVHPLTFLPDEAILVNRAQTADLYMAMTRIAWELQLSGYKAPWQRLESSTLADLGRAFAREALMDFRTVNNGVAAGAVFESWFLSERCNEKDRALIQKMLADYSGYVFDDHTTSKTATADIIFALGTMPFGKNYLAPYTHTIMSDPVFTEVRDRSNANFLWFIKFERSFREAEQELQAQELINSHDDHHGDSDKKTKGTSLHEQTAEIISFTNKPQRNERYQRGNDSGTRIVDFQKGQQD